MSTTPLILTGLSVALAFRVGLFNIGAEGQLYIGSLFAVIAGFSLVGLPWFGDNGILFYRTDLLEKYGFSAAPVTWTELEEMAQTIQDGEVGANSAFAGFTRDGFRPREIVARSTVANCAVQAPLLRRSQLEDLVSLCCVPGPPGSVAGTLKAFG